MQAQKEKAQNALRTEKGAYEKEIVSERYPDLALESAETQIETTGRLHVEERETGSSAG